MPGKDRKFPPCCRRLARSAKRGAKTCGSHKGLRSPFTTLSLVIPGLFRVTVRPMNRLVLPLIWLSFLLQPSFLRCANKPPLFDVKGPTIIAFCPPASEAELSKHPDINEALSDFQFYARAVRQPLEKKHIEFRQVYARQFAIRGGEQHTVISANGRIGYYFVTPGKRPHVEYGVMTDTDLLQAADKYFGSQQ